MSSVQDHICTRALRFILPGTYAFLHHDSVQMAPQNVSAFLGSTPKPAARRSFLFWLCAFITVLLSLEMFVEFGSNGEGFGKENDLPWIYLTLLAAYAADKELGHWASNLPEDQIKKRKGEWFIVWWVLYAVIMLFLIQATNLNFVKPHNLLFVLKGVLAIFMGSAGSKYLRMANIPQDVPQDSVPQDAPAPDAPVDTPPATDFPPADPDQANNLGQSIRTLLRNHPGGLTSGEIAEQLGVGKTSVKRALLPLLAAQKIIKIAEGPRDPNTRYKNLGL